MSLAPMDVDKYQKYYHDNCMTLDANTFSSVRDQVVNFLSDPQCSDNTKLLFGQWLFTKIYMSFKFDSKVKDLLCSSLSPSIEACMAIVPKATYLQYRDIGATGILALHFYHHRFVGEKFFILQLLNDVELTKNYIQNSSIDDETLIQHFLSWISSSPIYEQQSNILDICLRYYPRDPRVKDVRQKLSFEGAKTRNLYSDRQNAHDEEITDAVIQVATKLIKWSDKWKDENPIDADSDRWTIPPNTTLREWMTMILYQWYSPPCDYVDCVIERSVIDTTTFGEGFAISDVLLALILYILASPLKAGILPVLKDELIEMKELCASGYIARFVSVLQGFDETFAIYISSEKRLYAILSSKLGLALAKADEKVSLGSIDPEYKVHFLNFVKKVTNDALPSILEDTHVNDEFNKLIVKVLTSLSNHPDWKFNGQSVTFTS